LSPEKLGLALDKVLVMNTSAIGVILAIAEVSIVEICISGAKIAVVSRVGSVRMFVKTLAVIVTEKLLFAGMRKIGSCSIHKPKDAIFIGVVSTVGICVAFWNTISYAADVGKTYLR